jgi:ABC-type sugar transport system permease subunit
MGYASALAYTFFAIVFVLTLLQMRFFGREQQ